MRHLYWSFVISSGQHHSNSHLSWTHTATSSTRCSIAKSTFGAVAFKLRIVLLPAAGVRSVVGIERREKRRRFLPIPMLRIGAWNLSSGLSQ